MLNITSSAPLYKTSYLTQIYVEPLPSEEEARVYVVQICILSYVKVVPYTYQFLDHLSLSPVQGTTAAPFFRLRWPGPLSIERAFFCYLLQIYHEMKSCSVFVCSQSVRSQL